MPGNAQRKERARQREAGQDRSREIKEAKGKGERENKKVKETKEKESGERDTAKQRETQGLGMEGVSSAEVTTIKHNAQQQAKEQGHYKRSGPRSHGTIRE